MNLAKYFDMKYFLKIACHNFSLCSKLRDQPHSFFPSPLMLLRLFAQRGVKMFVCINLQQTTTGVVDVDEDEDDDDDGGGSGSPGAAKREG